MVAVRFWEYGNKVQHIPAGSHYNQRWLWHAVDHATNTVLAYVFGRRKDEVFKKLKKLLEPFGIKKFYTDDWGAYERNLDENKHVVGKENTQKIERKNLNFRTWIKRLARKTICFSRLEQMHDIVRESLWGYPSLNIGRKLKKYYSIIQIVPGIHKVRV